MPAGSTPHPARWTPGISTGALKVTTVFLSDSSALALGTNIVPASVKQNTVAVAAVPNNFTGLLLCLRSFKSIPWSIGAQRRKSRVYAASKCEIGNVVAQGVDLAGS